MRRHIVYWFILATLAPFLIPLGDLGANLQIYSTQNLLATGSIFGFFGVVLLLWQFIFGLRFISSRLSSDTVWFNSLHKSIGKYGLIFILIHPFLKAITYYGNVKYVILANPSDFFGLQVGFGRLALLLLLIVAITSIFFRKTLGFRLWKYIHYVSYLIMTLVFLHASVIGTYLNSYPLLKFYWYGLALIFGAIVIYRIAVFLGFGSTKYVLLKKEQIKNTFIYTFKTKQKAIDPRVGQYCYIKFKKFGEEHPFTVMDSDLKKKTLTFGIKAQGKFTKKLSELVVGSNILVEGPYGIFTLEGQSKEPKVIIAGGIGVTPFIGLVKKYGNNETYMFYANHSVENAIGRDELISRLGIRYFDVVSDGNESDEGVIKGRLSGAKISKVVPKKVLEKARFFICGNMPFYKFHRGLLLSMGVSESRVFYEEFGF